MIFYSLICILSLAQAHSLNKNTFQQDVYCSLVDRIPACAGQDCVSQHALFRGGVHLGGIYPGHVCPKGLSAKGCLPRGLSAWVAVLE